MTEAALPEEELSFEEALAQLEELVEQLESGELPLDQAMEKFEASMHLRTRCEELLTRAEARVEELAAAWEEEDSA